MAQAKVSPEMSSASAALPPAAYYGAHGAAQTPASMSPIGSIRTCFSKYVDFSGRATRAEYWWWLLFTFVGLNVVGLLMTPAVYIIVLVGLSLPGIAVAARRLYDVDRSGWWMLVPLANFIFLAERGSPGTNSYGPPA